MKLKKVDLLPSGLVAVTLMTWGSLWKRLMFRTQWCLRLGTGRQGWNLDL
uniref:Uncharacterized protein n=1 Tax=Anguilla anguilla TaxID=7936 RepID=A0A0E9UJ24_ANGAN